MGRGMDPCHDLWTIETVIVLYSNHGITLAVAEAITTTRAEGGDEVILTAVAEVEEVEEGEEWEVEDSKTVVEEAGAEVEVEEEEDFSMIEEVETVADQILEAEAEVEIDGNPFDLWMTCHHGMVNERDPVNCRHEETALEICLVMAHFEMGLESYPDEKKCSGTVLEESHLGEMKC